MLDSVSRVVQTIPNKDVVIRCKHCRSLKISKRGTRKNKSGDIQRMICKECGKTFSTNIGFRYRQFDDTVITQVLHMYHSGLSVRAISAQFASRDITIDPATIYRWVQRYSKVAAKYTDSLTPDVGDKFRADEVYVNVDGKKMYLFASMDDDTRYWLASDLAEKKHGHKAEALFKRTIDHAGKYPDEMITDGLGSYKQAARNEFQGMVKHTSEIHITGRHVGKDNNNKMERLNGTIRDREKTFRGCGTKHTASFDGLRVHYNHVRKHGALGGRTPGEAAGITVEGADKWRALIQNGSLHLTATAQRV